MSTAASDILVSDRDFEYIRQLIRERSGIVLGDEKRYLVESRLAPVVQTHDLASLGEFVRQLRIRPFGSLHRQVVEAMTTNETSFFRDRHPFEVLRKNILPELIERRANVRQLRIWCAACSSGQEPYTIAMLLREHFPELATWSVQLLGTDLDTAILTRAREGRYSQLEVNRGLPAPFLVKFFEKTGSNWQIKRSVRDMVQMEQLNLTGTWPSMPTWDIVFMRNVLIYFGVDNKKLILGRVRQSMKSDGYLFLGGAETTMNLDLEFERAPLAKAGCYRLRAAGRSAHAVCEA